MMKEKPVPSASSSSSSSKEHVLVLRDVKKEDLVGHEFGRR